MNFQTAESAESVNFMSTSPRPGMKNSWDHQRLSKYDLFQTWLCLNMWYTYTHTYIYNIYIICIYLYVSQVAMSLMRKTMIHY